MIPWASSSSWQFCRACGNGGLSVSEACDKIVPIFFVKGFVNPILEGTIFVDGDFGDIGEEETEIFDNKIIVVEEGAAFTTNIIAAHSHHLLGWAVMQSTHCFSKKIKLSGGNHVTNTRDVIKHPPHMFIV